MTSPELEHTQRAAASGAAGARGMQACKLVHTYFVASHANFLPGATVPGVLPLDVTKRA